MTNHIQFTQKNGLDMVENMTQLHEVQPGDIARVVAFAHDSDVEQRFASKGIDEGCFVRIVSVYGLITFHVNSKVFTISKDLAEKVRVIVVGTNS
jgi:Fe2+ transport system protein FeoA